MGKSGGGLEIRSVDGEVREGRWGREGRSTGAPFLLLLVQCSARAVVGLLLGMERAVVCMLG